MKKLLFALALLIISTQGAFAISCDPNTDKFNVGQWCITTSDTLVPTTSASSQVIYERYTTANTNNQLLESESGKFLVDTGGATGLTPVAGNGGSKHILPRAKPGLTYTVCTGAKIVTTVDTLDTSDLIEASISGTNLDAGDSLKSTGQAGECATFTSTLAGRWNVIMNPAVWSDNGTS